MGTLPDKINCKGTLGNVKTALSTRIRSKPTIEGQRYLDLYVLQRDRFRWLRLMQQAQRSIQGIDLALRKLGFTPDYGQSESATDSSAAGGAAAANKPAAAKTVRKRARRAA
ncbi:MAG: hypothetical protein ABR964_06045 [Tepidisphaeraceae bacterium]|jgi:hypothetical protein